MVTEISKTTNFHACFMFLLTNLLIDITFLYLQVFLGEQPTLKPVSFITHFYID